MILLLYKIMLVIVIWVACAQYMALAIWLVTSYNQLCTIRRRTSQFIDIKSNKSLWIYPCKSISLSWFFSIYSLPVLVLKSRYPKHAYCWACSYNWINTIFSQKQWSKFEFCACPFYSNLEQIIISCIRAVNYFTCKGSQLFQ